MSVWTIKFIVDRHPPDARNAKHYWVDLLLLDAVIGPLVRSTKHPVDRWDIHRRAPSDSEARRHEDVTGEKMQPGHNVTFTFEAGSDFGDILSSYLSENLLMEGLKGHDSLDGFSQPTESTSARGKAPDGWDPRIWAAWPRYIHGLSMTLLQLVIEIRQGLDVKDPPTGREDWSQVKDLYQRICAEMDALWPAQVGQFIHHLNARCCAYLFGELVLPRPGLVLLCP